MKALLLTLALSPVLYAQTTVKHYAVESTIVGYTCPDGYFYHQLSNNCSPKPSTSPSEPLKTQGSYGYSHEAIDSAKAPNINIYNYNGTGLKMPVIDLEGQLPKHEELEVRRRKALDKQAIIKLLDGDYSKEEPKHELSSDEIDGVAIQD